MKSAKREQSEVPTRCRYCGAPIVRRSADGIYRRNHDHVKLYVCARYPACDAYVRIDPLSGRPVGTLANARLRAMRRKAHESFDQLYRTGYMSKNDAYFWLAVNLCVPKARAHIGYLDEYYCEQVIQLSKKELNGWEVRKRMTGGISA